MLGVMLAMATLGGRFLTNQQEQSSFVTAMKQIFWRGATIAASEGNRFVLKRTGNLFEIVPANGGPAAYTVEIPDGATVSLPQGSLVEFTAPGRVNYLNLPNDCNGTGSFSVNANENAYCFRVSIIGEVEVANP